MGNNSSGTSAGSVLVAFLSGMALGRRDGLFIGSPNGQGIAGNDLSHGATGER